MPKGLAHLRRADPVLAELIAAVGKLPHARDGRPDRDDHYGALVRAIVGQQLSVKAARAIYGRLTDRFDGRPPTPAEILDRRARRAARRRRAVAREGGLSAVAGRARARRASWSWSASTSWTTTR